LLTNSAKYMKPGGHIRFGIQQVEQTAEISVIDDGVGIPEELIGQVFDMFTQVNRTLDRAEGGLGVGLSLVKTLINMHGGAVRASSDGIDLGSEFKVTLPLALEGVLDGDGETRPAITYGSEKRAKPMKILVVDDNVDAANTMAMLLGLSEHQSRTAFSGQEALDIATTFKPDIVFLDIGLPGMNGYEVAKRLQKMPVMTNTKLIALTGWGTAEDVKKSKNAGFYAHLTKPVDPDEVDTLLAQLANHA
jgi:CheY-like chemotaxis protein